MLDLKLLSISTIKNFVINVGHDDTPDVTQLRRIVLSDKGAMKVYLQDIIGDYCIFGDDIYTIDIEEITNYIKGME